MEALWNNFNEIAEGFGVSLDEFIKICDVPGWGVTEKEATNFFKALDTDEVRPAVLTLSHCHSISSWFACL